MAASKPEKMHVLPTKALQFNYFENVALALIKHTGSLNISHLYTAFYKCFFHCMKLCLSLNICTRYVPHAEKEREQEEGKEEPKKSVSISIQRTVTPFAVLWTWKTSLIRAGLGFSLQQFSGLLFNFDICFYLF